MNCDQVFDALTRGPFPTGNDSLDERVERHLAHCGSCRRLAAALQPAVELFEEAVSPEESSRLPAYWGELFAQSDSRPATRTRAPRSFRRVTSRRHRRPRVRIRLEHFWRIAAALLIGMAVGGVMRAALDEEAQPGKPLASRNHDRDHRVASWQALGMSAACGPMAMVGKARPQPHAVPSQAAGAGRETVRSTAAAEVTDESSASAGLELVRQKCCTDCHHARGTVLVASGARTRIARSCELCHVDAPVVSASASMGGGE